MIERYWYRDMQTDRWRNIIELLEEKKFLSVEELMNLLDVSPATIRRELAKMEEEKVLVRYRGGARLVTEEMTEETMSLKNLKNTDQKTKIAALAASLVKDNNILFLDAGSTTFKMIEHLKAKNITVVTTGISHVAALSKRNIKTFLLGGFVKPNTEAVTGINTAMMIKTMNFDIAFLGANGIHKTMGYMTPESDEGEVKRLAIQNSGQSYVLADVTKVNVLCFVSFAALSDATLITDAYGDFDYSLMKTIVV